MPGPLEEDEFDPGESVREPPPMPPLDSYPVEYDEEDYEDPGGVNMVDSLIRSLPALIGAIVVAMIVYSIYGLFTGPVAGALGEMLGGLAGVMTELMKNWRIFLMVWLIKLVVVGLAKAALDKALPDLYSNMSICAHICIHTSKPHIQIKK